MAIRYLQLQPGSKLLDISAFKPFRSVVVIDIDITPEWRTLVSAWLVKSGCLYMMAWGKKCSSWDDDVDYANLEEFNYGDIPEDKFVYTTWHEKEQLREVFRFAKNHAFHPKVELPNTLILHVSDKGNEEALLSEYASA